jgi:regulator of replication initiation timing
MPKVTLDTLDARITALFKEIGDLLAHVNYTRDELRAVRNEVDALRDDIHVITRKRSHE